MSHFNIVITGATPYEAGTHLLKQIVSGQIDDEIRNDLRCVIDCAWIAGREFAPSGPGPFGAVAGPQAQLKQELEAAVQQLQAAPQLATAAGPRQGLPWGLILQLILALINRQQNP